MAKHVWSHFTKPKFFATGQTLDVSCAKCKRCGFEIEVHYGKPFRKKNPRKIANRWVHFWEYPKTCEDYINEIFEARTRTA